MLVSDDETQMTADLVTVKGEVFRQTFMTTDFNSLQRFKNLLNKRTIALSYTGTEGDLELLKNFLSELEWVRKVGVSAQGLYWLDGRWVYAALDGAIEQGGKAVSNVLQLERCKGLQSAVHRQKAIGKEQLLGLGPLLLGYNEPAKTVSVLAWAAGCFIKPHLRKSGIKYPHLFLIGEAGSGKSNTLEQVILPIFAQNKVTAATQVSSFTLMKESASSNLAPQPLDEFKPSKMDKTKLGWLYNHFRDSYDGHQGQRGRADQTILYYDLLAPLVVAGEESPDETAIRERGIELLFSRKDLKPDERREAFGRLCAAPELLTGFGRALLEVALRSDAAEVKQWYTEACEQFDKALPSRIVNNLACCAAGLRLLEKLCTLQGLPWKSVFDLSLNCSMQYLGFAAREYLLDGNTNNRGIVEQSLEIMARIPGFFRDKDQWSFVPEQRGILIPVRDVQGRIQGLQVRRDATEKRKFRWVSSASYPDGCRAEGWTHFVGPPREKIILIEGPLKADVVHQLTGQTVLAVPGVNALTHLENTLLTLRKLGVRHIMTAFDMDFLSNPHVQSGYDTLTQKLMSLGFRYGTYLWDPGYNGLDDYVWEGCRRAGV